jgi:Flp pilus assembly protein TadB
MAIFGGKKKSNKNGKKKRREKHEIPIEQRRIYLPHTDKKLVLSSREYRLFKETEKRKPSWYERLAGAAGKFIKMSPDKNSRQDLESAIAFTGMKITPDSVMSLFVSTVLFFVIIAMAFLISMVITGLITMTIIIVGIGMIMLGVLLGYYLFSYPKSMVKAMRVKASSQVVIAVLYMVISMRSSPNLEKALRFAASNVSGELAWDMRRLLWDIEMRKYHSAAQALSDYIVKWKPENEEFAEALRLIRDSQTHSHDRSRVVLDEALEVILEGTKTRMKHYAQEMKMPVMIIHMMGIVLPIMGTIMAPLTAVFMADMVGPIHFIIGYDIVLPIIILWFINYTLSKRPVTFSQIDISTHPDIPKKGRFSIGKTSLPILPITILILIAFLAYPVIFFVQSPELIFSGVEGDHSIFSLLMSMMIILGIGFAIAIHSILSNFQRARIQSDIQSTEGDFELALFQLGNKISGGTPTELAIEKSINDVKDLKIADLFILTLRNIRNLGMTFEDALFNKKWGSLRYFPSKLIRNVMYVIVDTAKAGVQYASESMLRIARYLKNVRETQEYIRELLADTSSSMKFQAYFLTPMITGLIVSMTDIIVKVLSTLGKYLEGAGFGSSMGIGDMTGIFGNMGSSTSPEMFQFIVGVYLLEVIIILGIFTSRIMHGEDKTIQWYSIGKILIVGIILYFLVAMLSTSMFGELISSALEGIGIIS